MMSFHTVWTPHTLQVRCSKRSSLQVKVVTLGEQLWGILYEFFFSIISLIFFISYLWRLVVSWISLLRATCEPVSVNTAHLASVTALGCTYSFVKRGNICNFSWCMICPRVIEVFGVWAKKLGGRDISLGHLWKNVVQLWRWRRWHLNSGSSWSFKWRPARY